MRLHQDIDLGYCTNIHRGETWTETFEGLRQYTDRVREEVAPARPYGIGLRLSNEASIELTESRAAREQFRAWLEEHDSYLYTINGFPFGKFHGSRVKEQVYVPDWAAPERLEYTLRLFRLLDDLAPSGQEISVSTLPGSFKEFIREENEADHRGRMHDNLRRCAQEIESIREASGRDIHLGMEPEPLGLFETSAETVEFFEGLLEGESVSSKERILSGIGVNYDTCHLAIEYEEPADAIGRIREAGIRISKVHLSSALRLEPDADSVGRLESFHDEVYLHQVVVRSGDKIVERFRDLPDAVEWFGRNADSPGDEWRVHFHVPIHAQPERVFSDTRDHIAGLLDLIAQDPGWCRHFEMETYTWEVLPESLRAHDVVEQITREYQYCMSEFERVGIRTSDPRVD